VNVGIEKLLTRYCSNKNHSYLTLPFSSEASSLGGYNSRGGHGYGNNNRHGNRSVASMQASRSARSRAMDARLRAPIAKNEEQWLNDPGHYDLPDVDLPKPKGATEANMIPRQIWRKRELIGNMSDQNLRFTSLV